MSFAIACTDLSFAWPDGKPVLTGLNAAFNPGRTVLRVTGLADTTWPPDWTRRAWLPELTIRGPERIALIGPNGAGKSTLLNAIARLSELPGVSVRAATTAYLPQRLDILDDDLTVFGNLRAVAAGGRHRTTSGSGLPGSVSAAPWRTSSPRR